MVYLGLGLPSVTGGVAAVFYGLAFALAGGGLAASTFHLGHPERAPKAFTQWRTSWLSREAWLAVFALAINGLAAALAIFADTRVAPLGWLGATLALATVYATSMIYAQLRTVPRWNQPLTPALFLALAFAGGAILSGHSTAALYLLAVSAAVQFALWKIGDAQFAETGTNAASATGLGNRGEVRSFEPPHTGASYLTREMVFVVARRHALKLRSIGLALAFAAPALLLLLPFQVVFGVLAAVVHIAGVLVLRWLFFAEAEHVVGVYYGRS